MPSLACTCCMSFREPAVHGLWSPNTVNNSTRFAMAPTCGGRRTRPVLQITVMAVVETLPDIVTGLCSKLARTSLSFPCFLGSFKQNLDAAKEVGDGACERSYCVSSRLLGGLSFIPSALAKCVILSSVIPELFDHFSPLKCSLFLFARFSRKRFLLGRLFTLLYMRLLSDHCSVRKWDLQNHPSGLAKNRNSLNGNSNIALTPRI